MTDDFDGEVEEWFNELEGQLAPAGRVTAARPDPESPPGHERPVSSNPSTLASRRPVAPGLRRTSQLDLSDPEPVQEMSDLPRREPQPGDRKPEMVRTEALVEVMKELASEIKSVRRDVRQIKRIINKLRQLVEVKTRGTGSPATSRTIPPSG